MYRKSRNYIWYLDNGYSKHIIGDRSKILSLTPIERGQMTIGDNFKGKVISKGPNIYILTTFHLLKDLSIICLV